MNGERVAEYPVNLQWVAVESNTNWQVALILLDLNVKVTFRHKSRSFTISAPSHTLGGKMKGLCGKKRFLKNSKCKIIYMIQVNV
jgi:hypothetical protein